MQLSPRAWWDARYQRECVNSVERWLNRWLDLYIRWCGVMIWNIVKGNRSNEKLSFWKVKFFPTKFFSWYRKETNSNGNLIYIYLHACYESTCGAGERISYNLLYFLKGSRSNGLIRIKWEPPNFSAALLCFCGEWSANMFLGFPNTLFDINNLYNMITSVGSLVHKCVHIHRWDLFRHFLTWFVK